MLLYTNNLICKLFLCLKITGTTKNDGEGKKNEANFFESFHDMNCAIVGMDVVGEASTDQNCDSI